MKAWLWLASGMFLVSAGIVVAVANAQTADVVGAEKSDDANNIKTGKAVRASAAPNKSPTQGNYWIGVECAPADGPLRAHLKLPEEQGLVVYEIIADSPAYAAGVKRFDLLLSANGQELGHIDDLVGAVQDAKEGELRLDLLRGAKPESLVVRPVKRPDWPLGGHQINRGALQVDPALIEQWLQALRPGGPGGEFFFVQPGMVFDESQAAAAALPDDVSVTINRSGTQPAKITVRRGEQSWEVTEDKLDALPEELRKPVAAMVRGGSQRGGALGALSRKPLQRLIKPGEKATDAPNESNSEPSKPGATSQSRAQEAIERAIEAFRAAPRAGTLPEVEKLHERQLSELRKQLGQLPGLKNPGGSESAGQFKELHEQLERLGERLGRIEERLKGPAKQP